MRTAGYALEFHRRARNLTVRQNAPVPDPPTSAPPQKATRDLDELRTRLERWLSTKRAGDATITSLETPGATGMSSETVLFETATERLVARLAPDTANMPVFPTYDLERQFKLMRVVGELGAAPVPPVLWCEPDPSHLGTHFIVMGRVDGVVPPDVMPYDFGDNWLFDASREDQQRLEDASVAVLGSLHAIEDPARQFDFVPWPEGSALRAHVDATWDYYQWVVGEGPRSPLIDSCFEWLEKHWPDQEGATALSWGDARIGNMLFRDFEPVAVLDWEMAGFGPPEIDVAWFLFLHRFFEDIATGYGLPGMPDFLEPERVCATYEKLTGYAPRDMEFFTMYAALRQGIVMSRVQRRAIHFGEAERPGDIDDLIMHRSTLEALRDRSTS
jgi:aminoglycoside phosphotransferase (APT) family kinase protein